MTQRALTLLAHEGEDGRDRGLAAPFGIDRVEYHMNRLARRKNIWWFRGEAKVGGRIACEANLGAMIAEP